MQDNFLLGQIVDGRSPALGDHAFEIHQLRSVLPHIAFLLLKRVSQSILLVLDLLFFITQVKDDCLEGIVRPYLPLQSHLMQVMREEEYFTNVLLPLRKKVLYFIDRTLRDEK